MNKGLTRQASAPVPYVGSSLLAWLVVLAKHKKLLLGLPTATLVIVGVVTIALPDIYTATTRILPPQQSQSSASAMLGQLGALAGITGGNPILVRNPTDVYVSILKSRTVTDNLIKRFDLMKAYERDGLPATRRALEKASDISAAKDGVITVHVDDQDRGRAAALANGYIEELYKINQTLAITEASQRRLFLEKQLYNVKEQLAQAEVGLKKTQQTTGLIKLDDQGKAIIESAARLQAQAAAKEVQLGAMRGFITETNPDFILAQRELAGLRAQLARTEQDQKRGGVLVPTERIPEAGLEYARKFRDVKYYETIFELLAKQYEIAKIDEARDSSLIQVLDRAIEPEEKSKPKRALILAFAAFIALFFAVLWAFLKESAERARQDPKRAELFSLLSRYLWSR